MNWQPRSRYGRCALTREAAADVRLAWSTVETPRRPHPRLIEIIPFPAPETPRLPPAAGRPLAA